MDKYIFTYVDEDREGIFRDLTSEEAKMVIDFWPSHKRFRNSLLNKAEKLSLSYQLILSSMFFYSRCFTTLMTINTSAVRLSHDHAVYQY